MEKTSETWGKWGYCYPYCSSQGSTKLLLWDCLQPHKSCPDFFPGKDSGKWGVHGRNWSGSQKWPDLHPEWNPHPSLHCPDFAPPLRWNQERNEAGKNKENRGWREYANGRTILECDQLLFKSYHLHMVPQEPPSEHRTSNSPTLGVVEQSPPPSKSRSPWSQSLCRLTG